MDLESTVTGETGEGLTERQRLFVGEYLVDFNGTRAAIAVGYSEHTAAEQASRLLTNVKVSELVSQKAGRMLRRLDITADRVLEEIAKLAFFDPRKLFNSDGSPKQIQELDDETAAAVAGLEVNELFEGTGEQKHVYGLVKKIKLADKGQNLERLGRYLKLFTDKKELTGARGEGPVQFVVRSILDES